MREKFEMFFYVVIYAYLIAFSLFFFEKIEITTLFIFAIAFTAFLICFNFATKSNTWLDGEFEIAGKRNRIKQYTMTGIFIETFFSLFKVKELLTGILILELVISLYVIPKGLIEILTNGVTSHLMISGGFIILAIIMLIGNLIENKVMLASLEKVDYFKTFVNKVMTTGQPK